MDTITAINNSALNPTEEEKTPTEEEKTPTEEEKTPTEGDDITVHVVLLHDERKFVVVP
jgi:hypothetical protein